MADAQITVIDGDQTQIVLSPGENPAIVSSIPGPQGPAGEGVPLGGTTNQVLFKQSGTNYDTAWSEITSAMIGDLEIVNADVSASAAIAGTKISPNFGSQNVVTTGTSTAASFIPTSSTAPTNGVYLPAANSVALATNSLGRLFVDASGNVGVGTSNPTNSLQVERSGAGTIASFRTKSLSDGGIIGIVNGAEAAGYLGDSSSLGTGDTVNTNFGIRATQNRNLTFVTGLTPTERLRITSAGLVGIGTSAPSTPLHVSGNSRVTSIGSNASTFQLQNAVDGTDVSPTFRKIEFLDSNGGEAGNITSVNKRNGFFASEITFSTRSPANVLAERVRIDSSGRVGIGTTSPDTALTVLKNSNADFTSNATLRASSLVTFDNSQGTTAIVFKGATTNPDKFIFAENIGATQSFGLGHVQGGVRTNSIQCTQTSNIIFNRSGSENGRWDSSGRLLVGTSSWYTIPDGRFGNPLQAGQQIKVSDAAGAYGGLAIVSATSTVNERIAEVSLNRQNGATDYAALSNNNPIGSVTFNGADGSKFVRAASIFAYVDGTPGANDMPGRLVFSTTADGAGSPTERMRISSSGVLSNGNSIINDITDGAGERLSGGGYIAVQNSTSSSGLAGFQLKTGTPTKTLRMQIMLDGDLENANNSYTAISDVKLKENIVDANSQWDDIKSLKVRNYNFKPETNLDTHKQIGLIAQELETVCPGLVGESTDTDSEGNDLGTVTKSVNYSVLYMKAVKALQEAMERIETLEASNTDLLARVSALESA